MTAFLDVDARWADFAKYVRLGSTLVGAHQEGASGEKISEWLTDGSNHVSAAIMMYGLVFWMRSWIYYV